MNRQSLTLFVTAAVLIGATAAVLAHRKTHQRLGQPGVKVVDQPVYGVEGQVVGTNSVYLPAQVLNFTSEAMPIQDIVLDWLPKDTVYAQRAYTAPDGFQSLVNVVLMGADRTSIHKPEYCLQGSGWEPFGDRMETITITQPHRYELPVRIMTRRREVKAENGAPFEMRALYVFWFVADNQLTADHMERMWWMARDMVRTGVLQRWAYVSCFSVCLPGQEEAAYGRMKELIAAMVPHFQLTTGAAPSLAHSQ